MISDFAETLFFTRAAVEADPALANVRVEGPAAGGFGLVSLQGRPDLPDVPALSFAGLFRVWDDIAASLPCPRCGARRLFPGASGGGMHRLIAFVRLHCPFCRETESRSESRWADFKAVREAVRAARLALAATPAGLPFDEAMLRLRALRAADLAVPARPLERKSLAADPSEAADAGLRREYVHRLLATLPERDRAMVEMRFGIATGVPATLCEVGKAFGVSTARADKVVNRALRLLRAAA